MNLPRLLKSVEKLTTDNSPAILTALGVVGTITTAVLAAQAAFRIGLDANAGHYEAGESIETRDLLRVPAYWREYIPAAISGTLTIVAIASANHVSSRRATAMAAAYSISEVAFSEYKEKVIERIGKSKERDVRDEIAQDRMKKDPVSDKTVIITGNGDVLCYDSFTGRYFMSSMEALKKAQNDINYRIINDGYASLGDFYDMVGIPPTAVSEEVGWNLNKQLELQFSAVMSDDSRPCISIAFNTSPNRNHDKFGG